MMLINGSRVVVSGGAGFIGGHLVRKLIELGAREIWILDNLSTGSARNLPEDLAETARNVFEWRSADVSGTTVHFKRVSVEDLSGEDVEKMSGADLVYHLAGYASPRAYDDHPLACLRVCSLGTEKLLDLTLQAKSGTRFVLASTSEVYGDPLEHPQRESYRGNVSPTGHRSQYDEGKRYAEALTMSYLRTFGVNTGIARIFNTYGPGMQLRDGRLVPTLIRQLLDGDPLTIHGGGDQTRSLCYVDDLIDGLILLGCSDEHDPVNLGNPEENTVSMIAFGLAMTADKIGHPAIYPPRPPDDPTKRCPDISLARKLLGWEPKISLKEGLRRTWASYQTQTISENASPE